MNMKSFQKLAGSYIALGDVFAELRDTIDNFEIGWFVLPFADVKDVLKAGKTYKAMVKEMPKGKPLKIASENLKEIKNKMGV